MILLLGSCFRIKSDFLLYNTLLFGIVHGFFYGMALHVSGIKDKLLFCFVSCCLPRIPKFIFIDHQPSQDACSGTPLHMCCSTYYWDFCQQCGHYETLILSNQLQIDYGYHTRLYNLSF
jgi:hypothetical protein